MLKRGFRLRLLCLSPSLGLSSKLVPGTPRRANQPTSASLTLPPRGFPPYAAIRGKKKYNTDKSISLQPFGNSGDSLLCSAEQAVLQKSLLTFPPYFDLLLVRNLVHTPKTSRPRLEYTEPEFLSHSLLQTTQPASHYSVNSTLSRQCKSL